MPGPEATASLPGDADTAYSSPPRALPGPQPCPRGRQPQCPRDGGFSEVPGVLVEPWPTGSCPPTPCLQARPLECPHLAVTRGWAHRPFCPQPPTIPALQSPLSLDPMPARGLGARAPFTDRETEALGQVRVRSGSAPLRGATLIQTQGVWLAPVSPASRLTLIVTTPPTWGLVPPSARPGVGVVTSRLRTKALRDPRPRGPGARQLPTWRMDSEHCGAGHVHRRKPRAGKGPTAPGRLVCPGVSLSRPSGQLRSSSRRPDVCNQAPACRVSAQGQRPPAPASVSGLRDKEGLI